jgi:hypothetical protein
VPSISSATPTLGAVLGGDPQNPYRSVEHVRVYVAAQFDLAVQQPCDLLGHWLWKIPKVE